MGGRGSSSGKKTSGEAPKSAQNRPIITYREPSQQEQRERATVNAFWSNYQSEGEAAHETNEALIKGLLKSGDITAQQAESLRQQNDMINRLNGSDAQRAEEAKRRQEELERLTRRLNEKQAQREAERKQLEAKAEEARRQREKEEEKRRKRQEAARKAAETRRRKKAEQEKDKPFDRSVWNKGLPTTYGNGGAVTSTYNRYAARRAKKFNDWWRANHPGWDND